MSPPDVSLSLVEGQLARQPAALNSFLADALPEAPPGSLFVGAGDSFAASSTASYLTSMKYIALDSYELISDAGIAKGRTAYFVTVSGNTASSVSAAKAVGKIAKRRVAITGNAKGKIRGAVDEVVFIPGGYSPRIPGTLSFSLCLLALLKSACREIQCDFQGVHARAKREQRKIFFSKGGTTYFLGNGAAFPICQYAALKVHEFLGARAQAERLEEFGHAPVFSLHKGDTVNAVCAFDPHGIGQKLTDTLRMKEFNAGAILPFGSNCFEQAFYLTFLMQEAVLGKAKSAGGSRPYFVEAKDRLAVSDSMIY